MANNLDNSPHPFEETLKAILKQVPEELANPRVGIICGSGLSTLASHFKNKVEVPYRGLPGFVEVCIPIRYGTTKITLI